MLGLILSTAGCQKERPWARFVFQTLALSLIFHIIAAVKSTGFYHLTEHFQVLEWVNYKLDRTPAADLPLEYHNRTLPWMLPAILTAMTHLMQSMGIKNPFDWALGYRLFAALLGWLATAGLTLCCYFWFTEKKWKKWAVLSLHFIWFIPCFHARTSSENISGSLFFIALSLFFLTSPGLFQKPTYLKQREQSDLETHLLSTAFNNTPFLIAFLVGNLFGLAIECQFQIIFMFLGILCWFFLFGKQTHPLLSKRILPIFLGLSVPILFGIWIDYWGYHQWTLTALNALRFHLMDLSLKWNFTHAIPPFGVLFLLSFCGLWIVNPKHPLTWCSLPLFCVNAASSKIEFYPFFPMLHMGGIAFIFLIQYLNKILPWRFSQSIVIYPILGLNVGFLVLFTTIPAWMPIGFYNQLYAFKPYKFFVNYEENTLFQLQNHPLHFYLPQDVTFRPIQNNSDFIYSLSHQEGTQWLFLPNASFTAFFPANTHSLNKWCTLEFSTLPTWLAQSLERKIERVSSFLSPYPFKNWALYRCQSPNLLHSRLESDSPTTH